MKLPISKFTVYGNSMVPGLQPGQDILSFNWFVKPKVGDIVVVRHGNKEIIKRVTKVSDPASPRLRRASREILTEGDNKDGSTDSRHFGPVGIDQIVGRVIYKSDHVPCPQCESPVIGIYGRKDAICKNCGFKLSCCGEP